MIGDRAYKNAMLRAEELRRELAQVEEFIELCRRYAGDFAESSESERVVNTPECVPAIARGGSLEDTIESVIREHGAPMLRSKILDGLANRGVRITSADPANYIGTRMYRAKERFVNLSGFGYWPASVVYEPAGYVPGTAPTGLSASLDEEVHQRDLGLNASEPAHA